MNSEVLKPKVYIVVGIPYKMNMLFHGYPGISGKTSLIYSLASELNADASIS